MNKWKHFLHKINGPIWWVSCKLVLEMSNRFLTFLCKSRRWTLHVNEGSSLFKMIQIFLFVRCTTDSTVVVYVSNGSDENQLLGGTQFRYVHAIKITDDKFPNIIRRRTSLSAALSYSPNWCPRKRNSWQKMNLWNGKTEMISSNELYACPILRRMNRMVLGCRGPMIVNTINFEKKVI